MDKVNEKPVINIEEELKQEEPKEEVKPEEEAKQEEKISSSLESEVPKQPRSPSLVEASAKSGPSLDELRAKANKERQDRKQEHLSVIEKLGKSGSINNGVVRDLLHVSQTSATRYLEELVKQGKMKKSGKGKAITYSS